MPGFTPIDGLSAHADRDELLGWLNKFKKKPQRIFVMHGEEETALSFAKTIQELIEPRCIMHQK